MKLLDTLQCLAANSISGGLLALLENPDELAKLRANPELVPKLVPEIIRWQSPVAHMARTALQDTELGGKQIKAGDRVADVIKPTGSTRIEDGDVIVLFTMASDVPAVERLFQVSIDFF